MSKLKMTKALADQLDSDYKRLKADSPDMSLAEMSTAIGISKKSLWKISKGTHRGQGSIAQSTVDLIAEFLMIGDHVDTANAYMDGSNPAVIDHQFSKDELLTPEHDDYVDPVDIKDNPFWKDDLHYTKEDLLEDKFHRSQALKVEIERCLENYNSALAQIKAFDCDVVLAEKDGGELVLAQVTMRISI